MSAIFYPCGCVEYNGDTKPWGDPNTNPLQILPPPGQKVKLKERRTINCKHFKDKDTKDVKIKDNEGRERTEKVWGCEFKNQREGKPPKEEPEVVDNMSTEVVEGDGTRSET